MPTTLAELLTARGVLPPALALDLIDRLAGSVAAGSYDVGRLVRLNPGAVELELRDAPPDGVAVGRLTVRPPSPTDPHAPYLAWPELGQALSGAGGLGQTDAGGEGAAVYCLGVFLYHMLLGR